MHLAYFWSFATSPGFILGGLPPYGRKLLHASWACCWICWSPGPPFMDSGPFGSGSGMSTPWSRMHLAYLSSAWCRSVDDIALAVDFALFLPLADAIPLLFL